MLKPGANFLPFKPETKKKLAKIGMVFCKTLLLGLIILAFVPALMFLILLKNSCCIQINVLKNDWSLTNGELMTTQCSTPCYKDHHQTITQNEVDLYNLLKANKRLAAKADPTSKSNFVIFEVGDKPVQWNQLLLTYFKTLEQEPLKGDDKTSINVEVNPVAKETPSEIQYVARPWRLEEINLVRRKSLVIGKFKWVLLKDKGVYHVTWEIDGGGITGHLFTESSEVNLSFWPNMIYHIRVETTMNNKIVQSETVTVDTAKAKFTRTDVLFDPDDYSFFVNKDNIYTFEIAVANIMVSFLCLIWLFFLLLCVYKICVYEIPENKAAAKAYCPGNVEAKNVLQI